MTDFSYKKYSLEQLDNWIHDAITCEDLTAQEIYDTVVKCVDDCANYHKKELSKTIDLLSLLKGYRPVDFDASTKDKEKEREYNLREVEYYNKRARLDAEHNMKSEASQKDWSDFWENSVTLDSSDC
jgi:hypothetical protein